jgi:hypothetical protein
VPDTVGRVRLRITATYLVLVLISAAALISAWLSQNFARDLLLNLGASFVMVLLTLIVFEPIARGIHAAQLSLKALQEELARGQQEIARMQTDLAVVSRVEEISLTRVLRNARMSIDVVSQLDEAASSWTSLLDQRYLTLQRDATLRGVAQRHLFIVTDELEAFGEVLGEKVRRLEAVGVEIRTVRRHQLEPAIRDWRSLDFVTLDQRLSFTMSDDEPLVLMETTPEALWLRASRFDNLWSLGRDLDITIGT